MYINKIYVFQHIITIITLMDRLYEGWIKVSNIWVLSAGYVLIQCTALFTLRLILLQYIIVPIVSNNVLKTKLRFFDMFLFNEMITLLLKT